jgi:hypothetical protein
MSYNKTKKLSKLARILAELDEEQAVLDTKDCNSAEDLRWCRIYLSKTMAAINTSLALDGIRTKVYKQAS